MKINQDLLKEESRIISKKPKDKNSNLKITLIAILLTIMLIIVIAIFFVKVASIDESIKLYVNGEQANLTESLLIIDDESVYFNVREISPLIGYESHSGEYKIEAEDTNKIFVSNKNETASMYLDSKLINKIEPDSSEDYKRYEMSEIATEANGDIYIISDGLETACNVKVIKDKNKIYVYSIDYIQQ